ncbi:unnamed protein product [Cunninghamella blakesleeana]
MSPTNNNETKSKSWFFGLFSQWHPLNKWHSSSSATISPSTSILPTSPTLTNTTTTTTNTTLSLTPRMDTNYFNERRHSQQTIGSNLSDDRYSSCSCKNRTSEERSRLSDLWLKTRKKHPHYPKFKKWRPQPQQHTPAISIYSTPPQEERVHLSHSFNDVVMPRRPSSLLPNNNNNIINTNSINNNSKRHSITSFMYDSSQPASPFILSMKNGQLSENELEDDDIDDYFLDSHYLCKWTLKHELLKLALNGRSISCPIENYNQDKRVLQVGCGDGTWCIDVALSNPKWTVFGMEESKYYDKSIHIPGNPKNMILDHCSPSILNALQQLPDQSFDLIDLRCLTMAYTFDEYQQLIKECWRLCKLGGYIEIIEMDMRIYHSQSSSNSMIVGNTIQSLNSEVIHLMESKSLDPRLARRLPDLLEEATLPITGYVSLPIGVWGGRLGVMFREEVHLLFESVRAYITDDDDKQAECKSDQDLELMLNHLDQEMEIQRSFMNIHYCFAQKS